MRKQIKFKCKVQIFVENNEKNLIIKYFIQSQIHGYSLK